MIIIDKDKIYASILVWIVSLNKIVEHFFVNEKEAIDFYCSRHCNPIYNKIHYDCESCPITEAKEKL